MQQTTDMTKQERRLTYIGIGVLICILAFYILPVIYYTDGMIELSDGSFFVHFFTAIAEGHASTPDFIILSVIVVLTVFLVLISISKVNAFKKRKIFDFVLFPLAFLIAWILLSSTVAFIHETTLMVNLILPCLLFIPIFIAYLRTRKYFVKKRKAEKKTEKKIEKEEKRMEKMYANEMKKQRKLKTTVTQDKDICIHIEFV